MMRTVGQLARGKWGTDGVVLVAGERSRPLSSGVSAVSRSCAARRGTARISVPPQRVEGAAPVQLSFCGPRGASEPGDDLETVASDFGELFRTRIEAGLARRGVLS